MLVFIICLLSKLGRAPGQSEGERGAVEEPKRGRGLEFIGISPQRAQRPQRILLHWLCVLCVLCGAVFHK